MMSNEQIAQRFAEQNCAQMILARYAKYLGADEVQLMRLSCGLVGGLQEGSVCGRVSGGGTSARACLRR